MLTLACFLMTSKKRPRHGFHFYEVNQTQCLAKGLWNVRTLHNYNRFEFKANAMKRNFSTGSSDLSISFLLVTLRTTCIYMDILSFFLSKSSQSPCDPFNQVIYAPPTGVLDSIRLTLYLYHPNFPIQTLSTAANKPDSDKTVVWVLGLQRTDRSLLALESKHLQSLMSTCQQVVSEVLSPQSSRRDSFD